MTTTAPTGPMHVVHHDGSPLDLDELFVADCGHLTDRAAVAPCGALDMSFDCPDCAQKHIDGCAGCLA